MDQNSSGLYLLFGVLPRFGRTWWVNTTPSLRGSIQKFHSDLWRLRTSTNTSKRIGPGTNWVNDRNRAIFRSGC